MLCEAGWGKHITEKQYTTDHKTIHIHYTVFPVMPIVVQLIKIFPTILWKVWFITKFMRMSLKALPKHE
jgi:3-hydroxymyristoyl/3-hydroxydecanoyl-(acyl carrier protein) dehydratase